MMRKHVGELENVVDFSGVESPDWTGHPHLLQTECGLAEPSIAQVFELLDSRDGVVFTPEKFLHLFNCARKAWQHTRRGAQGINLRSGKHPHGHFNFLSL